MLGTSLFGDELNEKVYIAESFHFSIRVFEPWTIANEIEVRDGIDVGTEESFENELTNVLISVSIITELLHF